ncbi:MAG: VanW family protein [Clostridia bacterium]|nr:VanW family protein [Clostridia bacterium]
MKKGFDGEKIAIIIVVIIVLALLAYILFGIFSSNKDLGSNVSKEINENKNKENNEISQEEKDKMNVDQNKIPNIPSEEPPKKEEYEQIATYTTTIYDRDQNRVDNIALANTKLNDFVVKKGEEFSYNNTIGPMNETQGFKKALGFDTKGNKIKISGGGLCQISSTLYNAVLLAGLEVTERHPHSKRVYYVPKDKDATIVYGSLDFKFKNNTDNDIIISATNDNVNVTITLKKIITTANNTTL